MTNIFKRAINYVFGPDPAPSCIGSVGSFHSVSPRIHIADAYAMATYNRCIDLIAGSIASCKLKVRQNNVEVKTPISRLLCHACNDDGILFRDTIKAAIIDAANYGSGYILIEREDGINISELRYIPHSMVTSAIDTVGLYYVVAGLNRIVLPQDLVHIRGVLSNGYIGRGFLELGAETIALAKSAQDFVTSYFRNGCNSGAFIEQTVKHDSDKLKSFVEEFKMKHSGSANAYKVGVLPFGMKYQPVQVNAEQAQIIQSREYQDLLICRVTGVGPALIGVQQSGDKNSAEQTANFYKLTLVEWFDRIETELELKLLSDIERENTKLRFDLADLLRADPETRAKVQATHIQWGIRNPNECRAEEWLPARPDGDTYLSPLNMVQVGNGQNATSSPTAAPGPEEPTASPPAPTPEADAQEDDQAEQDAIELLAPVIASRLDGLLVKEMNALRSLLDRGDRAAIDGFYSNHKSLVAESFRPVVETLRNFKRELDPEACAERYIQTQLSSLPTNAKDLQDWKAAQRSFYKDNLKKVFQ